MKVHSVIYDSGDSVQQLIDRGFEMPIHFAAIGTNGATVTGTHRFLADGSGFECEITAETPDRGAMTAPVNIMYVDSKGASALITVRRLSEEPIESSPAA